MMSRNVIVGLAFLSLLVAFLGWRSAIPSQQAGIEYSDNWDNRVAAMSAGLQSDSDADRFNALANSTFLPLSEAVRAAREADRIQSETTVPPFPQIVGAAIINGRPQVHILVEGEIVAKQSGDMTEAGWEIVSLDMDSVVARFSEEIATFPVSDYEAGQ